MLSNKAFTGVGNCVLAAGMSRTLHVAEAAAAATAHPAFWAYDVAGAAAAIPPQRKRRTTAATGKSVDRGTA
jgi:predicted MFS family arabinose efflux permease